MPIKAGEKLPSATLFWMGPDSPIDIRSASSDEIFNGKKVAVFGLPGAFTPVCSAEHLPGFVKQAENLKAKGIDVIACISMNDPFVMSAWSDAQLAGDKIIMLSDSTGEFTRKMDLILDLGELGLGDRSERYTMLVDDGVVAAIFVEDSILSCGVSSASALLEHI